MLEKDDGIVLTATRSGDTSLLATFLGRTTGKIRLLAKGVLTARHTARGLLESGNHLEVLYYTREGRTMSFLKEAMLLNAPSRPRDSLPHMAVMLAVMELLNQVCYAGAADAGIVDLGVECIRAPAAADPLLVFLSFEMRLLGLLGAEPDLFACAACGRELSTGSYSARSGEARCSDHSDHADGVTLDPALIGLAALCGERPLAEICEMTVQPSSRKALGEILHWTYTFHVQGYSLPNSLNLI